MTYTGLIGMSLIVGSAYLLADIALDEMDPVMLVTIQRVIGAVFFAGLVIVLRTPIIPARRDFLPLVLLALTNSVLPFLLIAWGQERIDSGTAGVLAATTPLFAAMLGALLIASEKFESRTVPGLLLGFVGIAIIAGVDLGDLGFDTLVGDLAVVAAALSFAYAMVLIRTRFADHDMMQVSALTTFIMVGLLVPVASISHTPSDVSYSADVWLALVGIGVGVAGVAIPLYIWLIKRAGIVRAALTHYLSPAIAVLLGWAFRDEEPALQIFLGLALILFSLAWVDGFIFRRQGKDPAERSSDDTG